MRRSVVFVVVAVAVSLAATLATSFPPVSGGPSPTPSPRPSPSPAVSPSPSPAAPMPGPATLFGAFLSGDEEVPVRNSPGAGFAVFRVQGSGPTAEIEYKLMVANIRNVFAAHIHQGRPGENGPIVVPLFTGPPAGGLVNGLLRSTAWNEITAATFEGPLRGRTMGELLALMRAGNAYVNVHTNDGRPPDNSGPGDFPGGEIRGHLHQLTVTGAGPASPRPSPSPTRSP